MSISIGYIQPNGPPSARRSSDRKNLLDCLAREHCRVPPSTLREALVRSRGGPWRTPCRFPRFTVRPSGRILPDRDLTLPCLISQHYDRNMLPLRTRAFRT
ncbi:hypothetical protein A0H81_08365 [Grifola frondosa]|uniref:Uncharacterized protein n=1 Tax=Grifola frondosa TaxID=5627 RepID=A0A1C7M3W4_GRIFR|nr:hypothetical protein A0H81_08365 [Grifola frondosa]